MSEFNLSLSQYGEVYAILERDPKKVGRKPKGSRQGVLWLINNNKKMPGVLSYKKVGRQYILRVDKKTYQTYKILRPDEK